MDKSIGQMERDLACGRYSENTQKSYLHAVGSLAAHFGRPVAELGRDDLRGYVELMRAQPRSASWLKVRLAAIVFLFSKTLGRPTDISFVVWPRQDSAMPEVLSQAEVAAFLNALRHPIYRAIALVLYGTGLRIHEALALQVTDIDGARGVLHVRHGKGNRPRQVKLSRSLYQWLRDYWRRQRPQPPYLFTSPRTGKPPTEPAVRAAFAAAGEAAGISKPVRPHVLRHSYATHLLDAGTDVRVIQALLGHKSLHTTMRYTRVSTALIQAAPSPVDLLPSGGRVLR